MPLPHLNAYNPHPPDRGFVIDHAAQRHHPGWEGVPKLEIGFDTGWTCGRLWIRQVEHVRRTGPAPLVVVSLCRDNSSAVLHCDHVAKNIVLSPVG